GHVGGAPGPRQPARNAGHHTGRAQTAPPSSRFLRAELLDGNPRANSSSRRTFALTSSSYHALRQVRTAYIIRGRSDTITSALVSDVQMPRLGGFELAAILRAERPAMKVLFVSGHAERSPCGAPLLAKPFRAAELTAAVTALLGQP